MPGGAKAASACSSTGDRSASRVPKLAGRGPASAAAILMRAGKEVPVEIYDNLYKQFNPDSYNPDEWVALARSAGMKYVVLTTRHHDGFSMFDTQASDYKITSPQSPYRRDIVKALAEACHKTGTHLGFYYSQPDWHHPDAFVTGRHAALPGLSQVPAHRAALELRQGRLPVLRRAGPQRPGSCLRRLRTQRAGPPASASNHPQQPQRSSVRFRHSRANHRRVSA